MNSILHPYQAFLFDLNGTMIDDMAYHLVAWSDMLNNQLNAGLTAAEVKAQMYGKNEELLTRVFGPERFTPEEMRDISMQKERLYQKAFLPELKLIEGLPQLLDEAKEAGIRLAIGSAAYMFNIDFVLDNLNIRSLFEVIISADDVNLSKPHPETYLKCARLLGVEAAKCLVFEDAPKGVEAAMNAGMDCVVLTTLHDESEFADYPNVIRFMKDYSGLVGGG